MFLLEALSCEQATDEISRVAGDHKVGGEPHEKVGSIEVFRVNVEGALTELHSQ